mgnify:CR=1 FL=1
MSSPVVERTTTSQLRNPRPPAEAGAAADQSPRHQRQLCMRAKPVRRANGRCWPTAVGTRVKGPAPERPRLRRRLLAQRRSGSGRSTPLSTFSTAGRARRLLLHLGRRRRRPPLSARSYPLARLPADAAPRPSGDARPRARRGSRSHCRPHRRSALRHRRSCHFGAVPGLRELGPRQPSSRPRPIGGPPRRARGGRGWHVTPPGPDGHRPPPPARRSEPKGVVHTHGAHHPPPRQPRTRSAATRDDEVPVLRTRRVFWIGGLRLLAARHARRRRRRAGLLERADAAAFSTSSSASGRRWSAASRSRSRTCRATRRFAAPRPRHRSVAATCSRSCPRRSGRRSRTSATAMLRHDRDRQRLPRRGDDEVRSARSTGGARSAGRRPASRRSVVDPDTGATCGPARRASSDLRGPFLDGGLLRARAARGLRRRRLVSAPATSSSVDARRLLLLRGPPRRHDQDRAARTCRRARSRRRSREVTGLRRPRDRASTTTPRGQIVGGAVRVAGRPRRRRRRARAAARASASPPTRCRDASCALADDEVPMLSSGKLDLRALEELFACRLSA